MNGWRKRIAISLWVYGILVFVYGGAPPQKVSFQTVIRDAQHRLVCDKAVGVRFKILQQSPSGPQVFAEQHATFSNRQGLVSLTLGAGTPLAGAFADIDWGAGPYYIETAVAFDGTEEYELVGTQEIVSVPYALYAEKARSAEYDSLRHLPSIRDTILQFQYWNRDSLLSLFKDGNITNLRIESLSSNDCKISSSCSAQTPIVDRGICYDTAANPTLAGAHISCGPHAGDFSSQLNNLISGTNYHVRAYCQTAYTTLYSDDTVFVTSSLNNVCAGHRFCKDWDGNLYNTVAIGNQCWMRENLRATHYADGQSILNNELVGNLLTHSPQIDEANLPEYGYLYSWSAIMDGATFSADVPSGIRGPCPEGWHLPSPAEYQELIDYVRANLQGSSSVAVALANCRNEWNASSLLATGSIGDTLSVGYNSTGFSVRPAGYYSTNISSGQNCIYCQYGYDAYLATSNNYNVFYVSYYTPNVSLYAVNKKNSVSVRCLKD